MKKDEVIKILKRHNEWRTDKNVPPKSKMIEPSIITEAINSAIELLLTGITHISDFEANRVVNVVNECYGSDLIKQGGQGRIEYEYRMIAYHLLSELNLNAKEIGAIYNREKSSVSKAMKNFYYQKDWADVRVKYENVLSKLTNQEL